MLSEVSNEGIGEAVLSGASSGRISLGAERDASMDEDVIRERVDSEAKYETI